MMYRVMKATYSRIDGDSWAINFTAIPDVLVKDMAEAKARFGGSPVLQESLR